MMRHCLQTVEPGLLMEDLAARYYHSYVELIGGRQCTSSALPRYRAADAVAAGGVAAGYG